MQLDSRCLNATFNLNESEGVSPRLCQVMEDDWTTCGVAEGVCLCSTRTVSDSVSAYRRWMFAMIPSHSSVGGSSGFPLPFFATP